jgi:dynein assembly factor with WDR repeat domains 1
MISTYRGHTAEIVCLAFDPMSFFLVTGSMDKSAILWNLETEQSMMTIDGHEGEVISISFNTDGDKILTGSFDYTAKVNKNFK